ncbi:MAG TPA: UDP-glucose/GDP-mannose dehydrogenase family protein, partial [Solirubrobacteraceae bacterium]|nr:UDP-glucose/GDP-mannose dehydrogenase family protein [Solirubrobacteraceae bacterium]
KLVEMLGADSEEGQGVLHERRVAIWGLTYKPGTDTLRRSSAVELCRWLLAEGADVRAHDPAVRALPSDLATRMQLCDTPLEAARDAEVLVVCTPWPDYLQVPAEEVRAAMASPQAIDPAGALKATLGDCAGLRYVRVGTPSDLGVSRVPSAAPAEEART